MSNASLIQRMHAILDSYDPATISPETFQKTIAFHLDGLEGVELPFIHLANELATKIVRAHFFDADEEFGSPDDAQAAIAQLQQLLAGLPT